jgi:hypothetical protein
MTNRRKPWVVVRRKGTSPIQVVAGEHYRTLERAEKETIEWNKAFRGSGIKFSVRRQDWRRKRWWS